MWHWDMGPGWGWGGMLIGGMFLLPLLLIGLIAVALGWRPQINQGPSEREQGREKPLEILKKRYARGEIDRATYEGMRRDLES